MASPELTLELTYVSITDREEPWRRVVWLGGTDAAGHPWAMKPEEAIDELWRGTTIFVATAEGPRQLIVLRNGLHQYLALEGEKDLSTVVARMKVSK